MIDRRTALLVPAVAALGLIVAAAPALAYSGQNAPVPPQEAGVGRSDVRDEPTHTDDANGFATGDPYFSPQDGALVLDSYYEANLGAANIDLNNVLNRILHGNETGEYDRYMYPGLGYFGAYWGYWSDTGSGGDLQDEDAVDGTASVGEPDGMIDDAHDSEQAGWDEFVWRGENKWAPDHGRDRHPGDTMHLFIQPGTWHNVIYQAPYPPPVFELDCCGYLLRDDHDDGRVPDMVYSDRTNTSLTLEDQGWVTGAGFPHINYDASLLVTTEARTAVNAPSQGGLYDPLEAEAVDVDVYATIHPTLAEAYQATVWDTGDRQDGSDDGGPKDTAKEEYTRFALRSEDILAERQDQATRPVSPATGFAVDAAGERPRAHEPNHPDDAYEVDLGGTPETLATHGPGTTYGTLAGNSTDYYEPGDDQTYPAYQTSGYPFLDIRPGYGAAAFPVQRYSFNVAPAPETGSPTEPDDRTAAPGLLSFRGNFGTWHDSTGDTFVGNLDEFGRPTSTQDPYRNGTVDDPNDYGDHPGNHEGNPSKGFQWTPEWEGLCGAGNVEVTAVPDNPQQAWGTAGVYVIRDDDGSGNPYDDMAADAADDRSYHVTHGEIEIPITCDTQNAKEGEWLGEAYILVPAGNPTFDVRVTSTGTVTGERTNALQEDLEGTQVTDVDEVVAWT